MNRAEFTFTSGGADLFGVLDRVDDRPIGDGRLVLLSHGLSNNHADAPMFSKLRDQLLSRGIAALSFDYFGSGRSDGTVADKSWTLLRANLEDALCEAERLGAHPSRTYLVGRSVGATIAAFYAADPRVHGTVLASPVFFVESQFAPYFSTALDSGPVDMPATLQPSGQLKGKWALSREFQQELTSTETELRRAVTGATNVLVLHGAQDTKVTPENGQGLFELVAEPRGFRLIENGDHNYTGVEETVVDAIVEWIEK